MGSQGRNEKLLSSRVSVFEPTTLEDFMSTHRRFNTVLTETFCALLVVAGMALGPSPAQAQCTNSWTGTGGDGNWSNGVNWSTGVEPGSSDSVCIQKSGAAVLLDVSDGIAGLTVGGSDSLTFPNVTNASPSLNINGSSITNSGQIIMSAPVQFGSSLLSLSSSGTVTLSGSGTITMHANSFGSDSIGGSATLLNKSTIQGSGAIDMTLNNASIGVVNANQSGVQLVVGRNNSQGASTNTGLMEATSGGQLAMGSLTLINVGGTIKASGTNSYVQLEGEGQGGETFIGGTWTTASGGAIQVVDTTALLDGTNGNTITNSGTMQLVDGAPHPGGNFQGTIDNTGSIQLLSKGSGMGVNIPGSQTFTLTGTGSLTMGDGTANSYNNQNYISGGTFVNQQLVQGTGSILNLTDVNNSGTINANIPTGTNNLQLQLGRTGNITNTGTIEASNGGVLVIGSTTINNVGGTIAATGTNSNVSLVGSLGTSGLTITGGTFDGSGGGVVYGTGGSILDGKTSTVNNTGTMIINGQGLQAQGTLNNTGAMQILAPNGQVYLRIIDGENLTITGKGSIIMGDGKDNSYNNNPALGNDFGSTDTLTNSSVITGTGRIGPTGSTTNNGVINANVPVGVSGLELILFERGNVGAFNKGTIEATNGGEIGFDFGGGSCYFTNSGTLLVGAKSKIDLTNSNNFTNLANNTLTGGTYSVTGTLLIPGNVNTNAARITLTGTASQMLNSNTNTNALAGFVTNATKGSFTLAGGQSFHSSGAFTNQGAISISKGSTFTVGVGGSYVQNGGKTTVNGTLTTSSAGDSGFEPTAIGSISILGGSLLGNGGTVAANVSCSGTVVPAGSPTSVGKLTINGGYTQSSTGVLDANIAAANAGKFNVLNVSGTAMLGGTLNIKLLKNFVPLIGATFEILTAQQVNGTFATVKGTAINASEHFTVTYNSNNVTLTVVSGM
jgi:fibronectin-binding autotransporter adhesin